MVRIRALPFERYNLKNASKTVVHKDARKRKDHSFNDEESSILFAG